MLRAAVDAADTLKRMLAWDSVLLKSSAWRGLAFQVDNIDRFGAP